MPNYQNGKIYKIWAPSTDKVYIGSTCVSLSQRLAKHREAMKLHTEGKYGFTTSYEILEYPDARIELVEYFPCNSKEELNARENECIRNETCINIMGKKKLRERKTLNQEDKEAKKIYDMNRRFFHGEEIMAKKLEKVQCECGCWSARCHLSKHRQTQKHKDLMA